MTRKIPSPDTPLPGPVAEQTTTITHTEHDITPIDDGDDSSIANGLRKRKYNPNLSASELGMDKVSWRNRQRMAYIALFAMIFLNCGLFLITDSVRLDKLGNALSWFDVSCAGIVGAFMGFKAFGDLKGRN